MTTPKKKRGSPLDIRREWVIVKRSLRLAASRYAAHLSQLRYAAKLKRLTSRLRAEARGLGRGEATLGILEQCRSVVRRMFRRG